MKRRRAAACALALMATLGGAAWGAPSDRAATAAAGGPMGVASTRSHVVVIVMENSEREEVLGAPDAPYLTRLARRGASATASCGVTHPSLPNYIALVSGSTQGITEDCTACTANGPNLPDQLERRHRT